MRKPQIFIFGFFLVISFILARQIFARSTIPLRNAMTVDSEITLASDGDVNNDGQVDAGDTVIFSYTIINENSKEFPLSVLKTNISRTRLNFIHDIRGTASLSDANGTIEIPNLFIGPNQRVMISFHARINYFQGDDQVIGTRPELIGRDGVLLLEAATREMNVRAWNQDMIPSILTRKKR